MICFRNLKNKTSYKITT